MEYYSASKKEEILSYATTWMKFEDIMSSTVSQSQRQIKDMIPPTWAI